MGNCEECSKPKEDNQFSSISHNLKDKSRDSFSSQNIFDAHKGLRESYLLSQSMVQSRLHKVRSDHDPQVSNQNVKRTNQHLPATAASQFKNVLAKNEEIIMESLKAKYVGEVENGKPHGYGKLYFYNGDLLEGIFVDGRCEGNGRFIKIDGSYYQGDFKNNVADGYGTYVGKKGFKYAGQWKNNVPNGSGDASYPDGSRYIGQFLNNKKNGKGTLHNKGSVYRGDFKNDHFDGKLKYEGDNGETYDGDWKQSKKHGYGVYRWSDGNVYEGQYFNGKKHGKGKMTYNTSEIYDGQWLQGLKHGKGHLYSSKQSFYGSWQKGNLVSVNNVNSS